MYDAALGRFTSIDPLADIAEAYNPYHFVRGNPINRIDPTGLTDFTLNKETGEVEKVKDTEDETDRVLKTDKDGNVKRKGEGVLGFLVKEENRGKAKVAFGGIEKGILKDGINFQEDNNVIDIGGENQATVKGFEDFALKLSNYVDKEIGGYYLSTKGQDAISHIYVGRYANNDAQNERSGFNLYTTRPDLVGNVDVRVDYHTHLSRFSNADRLRPSSLGPKGGDVGHKKRQSASFPSLKYLIITNPKPFEY